MHMFTNLLYIILQLAKSTHQVILQQNTQKLRNSCIREKAVIFYRTLAEVLRLPNNILACLGSFVKVSVPVLSIMACLGQGNIDITERKLVFK